MEGVLDQFFSEEERSVYRYLDRGAERFADPMVLYRRFREAQKSVGDYSELVREAASIEGSESDAALEDRRFEIVGLVGEIGRRTFGKQPLAEDGSGWTDVEGATQVNRFIAWQIGLEGKAETSPSGSTSTAGHPEGSADEVAKASISPVGTGSI